MEEGEEGKDEEREGYGRYGMRQARGVYNERGQQWASGTGAPLGSRDYNVHWYWSFEEDELRNLIV